MGSYFTSQCCLTHEEADALRDKEGITYGGNADCPKCGKVDGIEVEWDTDWYDAVEDA